MNMKTRYASMMVALLLVAGAGIAQEDPLAGLPRHIVLNKQQDVSGQPSVEAISRLRSAGITTVIDLRPDAETPDLDEKAVAENAGLKYRSLPIAGAADLTHENVARFDQLLKDSEREHVLLHCASGNRVGAMMALRARWLQGKSEEEALAIGKAAGMTGLADAVKQRMEQELPASQAPAQRP
jgi:uncharacterized protein (TIGR01244 family)